MLDIWATADLIAVDQDPAGNQATIAYGSDGKLLTKTPPMRFGDQPRDIGVDITGHKIIELVSASEAAANELPVVVTWGSARLEK